MNSAFFNTPLCWTVVCLHVETKNFTLGVLGLSQSGMVLEGLIFSFHRGAKVICFNTAPLHFDVRIFMALTVRRCLIVCVEVGNRTSG